MLNTVFSGFSSNWSSSNLARNRFRTAGLLGALAALGGIAGCNTLDDKPASTRTFRLVPTDERQAVQQETMPPAVSGGTLLAFDSPNVNGGALPVRTVAASDPARDRLSLTFDSTVQHISFPAGSQPGRLAHDGQGLLFAVLRNTGKVAMVDVASATVLSETDVCAAPRGIAYDSSAEEVVVACAEGHLVRFSPGTDSINTTELDTDLRDVVIQGDTTYVSRFRSAEVLILKGDVLQNRVRFPNTLVRTDSTDPDSHLRELQSSVAWRMTSDPSGGVVVVHQRAAVDSIDTEPVESNVEVSTSSYGGVSADLSTPNCASIVQTGVSSVSATGEVKTSASLSGAVLPVDVAVSNDGRTIAIASAGIVDPDTPASTVRVLSDKLGDENFDQVITPASFRTGIAMVSAEALLPTGNEDVVERDCITPSFTGLEGPATAVVAHQDYFVMQQREPAGLAVLTNQRPITNSLALGGESIYDTGHEVFHRDTGAGIACASCHPEGTDDGHVWNFTRFGERRTQHLAIPLKETAPFHWDGALPNLSSLMDEVFVGRMGGVNQSGDRLDTLQDWMFRPHAKPRVEFMITEQSAVDHGKELFDSTGCAQCHNGDALTDNKSYNVGTGDKLQVPSLVDIALHPPFMHNGCAKTLKERFTNEACGGGDLHGITSNLSDTDVEDLVAYLKTL